MTIVACRARGTRRLTTSVPAGGAGPNGASKPPAGAVKAHDRRSIAEDLPGRGARRTRSGWSPERRSDLVGIASVEIHGHPGVRLGTVPEHPQRKTGSDLAVSQLLGFAEFLQLAE